MSWSPLDADPVKSPSPGLQMHVVRFVGGASAVTEQTGGGGSLGPNLTGGSEVRQFDTVEDNVEFLRNPPEQGKAYGNQGQSTGRMPAFEPARKKRSSPLCLKLRITPPV